MQEQHKPDLPNKLREESAWANALETSSVAGFASYASAYPAGRFLADAHAKMRELRGTREAEHGLEEHPREGVVTGTEEVIAEGVPAREEQSSPETIANALEAALRGSQSGSIAKSLELRNQRLYLSKGYYRQVAISTCIVVFMDIIVFGNNSRSMQNQFYAIILIIVSSVVFVSNIYFLTISYYRDHINLLDQTLVTYFDHQLISLDDITKVEPLCVNKGLLLSISLRTGEKTEVDTDVAEEAVDDLKRILNLIFTGYNRHDLVIEGVPELPEP